MAGYMTKLTSYVYEGELPAVAATENGAIVELDSTGKKLTAATDTTVKLLCKEATTLYDNVTAYRIQIVKAGDTALFLVENEIDVNDSTAYNTSTYSAAAGELLRVHPLHEGEEFITSCVTGTLTVGTSYGVTAGKVA